MPPEEHFDPEASARSESDLGTTRPMESDANVGTVIGRYHLLQKIGEGGMGEVWLAEQREPVRRRVAVKLIKAGMNTREVIARFESERQALALMEHPAIAKVFDAGATHEGAPYFVMEYVAGVPITTYCDSHRLSTRDRLELFMHVCQGVQHAHQKAIIHRDLKPSNVLVSEVDGKPAPKIIDFGVAKALTQKLTADTMFTRLGALIGTPEYMSPEQARSSGEDIDTRTDIYSLGIILYELLAGVPPLDLRKIAFEEFLRRLREEDPPKPSTKIRTQDHATSATVAHKRQTEPVALAKQIRGDLDSIALKALEKDRSRRYATPSDFAADIARYLNNEPVTAVPPSFGYRAGKFVRRYRVALATICAFVLVLIAAAAISIRQSLRANSEAAVANAVTDFLQHDLLAQASAATQSGPNTKPDPDLKVRTVLDRAAARIPGKFDRQPEVEAVVRETIGQTYIDLGQFPEARTQLERALEVEKKALGPEHPKTLSTMSRLGCLTYLQGRNPEAEALLERTLKIQRRVMGPEHPETLRSMYYLAITYEEQSKFPQAEALESQTLEIQRRVLGPEHLDTTASMGELASIYHEQGKYPQAEALDSQALEIQRRVLGPEHPRTLGTMTRLGVDYQRENKYAQAEALDRETLEIRRRVQGPEHPDTVSAMGNLASLYDEQGKYALADPLHLQTLEIDRRVLGPEHPLTLAAANNLALVYHDEGKYAQAEAIQNEVLAIRRRTLGPEHTRTLSSMGNLAQTLASEGKYAEAETLYQQTLEMQRRVLGPEHPRTVLTVSNLANMYQRQSKFVLAQTYASQALEARRHTLGPEDPDTSSSAAYLALAYQSQGKFAESERLAREAVEIDRKKRPDDWRRFRSESLLGASLAGLKEYAQAEPLLIEGYQGMAVRKETVGAPDWYYLDLGRQWTAELYQAWGKPQKAAEWRQKPAPKASPK